MFPTFCLHGFVGSCWYCLCDNFVWFLAVDEQSWVSVFWDAGVLLLTRRENNCMWRRKRLQNKCLIYQVLRDISFMGSFDTKVFLPVWMTAKPANMDKIQTLMKKLYLMIFGCACGVVGRAVQITRCTLVPSSASLLEVGKTELTNICWQLTKVFIKRYDDLLLFHYWLCVRCLHGFVCGGV